MNVYTIANKLSKYPKIKRYLKNAYQNIGGIISNRKTFPSNINLISNPRKEHLFGYYDKSPWNMNGDKIIYLEVSNANKEYVSLKKANIILKNLITNEKKIVGNTSTWNVQQGAMLQWLGPDFNTKIIYNDFRNKKYCSIILNIETLEEKVIDFPVYSVAKNGEIAISLDFSRLNTFRPGYGYCNIEDKTKNEFCPNKTCIWKVDLRSNKITELYDYKTLVNFENRDIMKEAYHKINHIMISPNSDKFMFLHRWIKNGIKYDRLLTSKIDGTELFNLLDEDMVSHSNWKDNNTIITWANTYAKGQHYYILKDKSKERKIFCENILNRDGHPSYSPDGKWLITDTYPDLKRKQFLYLINLKTNEAMKIAEIYSNISYKNETRCDLHPRWKPDSSEICFDGAQLKYRQIYTLKIGESKDE